MAILIVSDSKIPSALRTADLSGSTYALDLLSGKIDVCHSVRPIFAITRKDPHPRLCFSKFFLISADSALGTYAKCQAPCSPAHMTTLDLNL